jgi:hypothetical protein
MNVTFSNLVGVLRDREEMGAFARYKVTLGRECLPLIKFIMTKDDVATLSTETIIAIRFFYIACLQLKALTKTSNVALTMNDALTKIASDIDKAELLDLKFRFLQEGPCHLKLIHAIEEHRWQQELALLFIDIVADDDPIEWYTRNNYSLTFKLPENKLLDKLTEALKHSNYNFE